MSHDPKGHICLFEINGTDSYFDCFWLAAICLGFTLAQFIVLAPLIKPVFVTSVDMIKQQAQKYTQTEEQQQSNAPALQVSLLSEQVSNQSKELEAAVTTFWKDYQRDFNVFGIHFTGYIYIICIACVFVTLGTIFLIYSVDDPREVWRNEGWKKSINGSTMLIVIVGGANGLMLGQTKKTIEHVLTVYKPTKATNLFKMVYWISVLSQLIFYCIYYPYIVCLGLSTAFSFVVAIGIICSCGICCAICCIYFTLDLLFRFLLYPITCCVKDEKMSAIKDGIVFFVFYISLTFGMMVAMLVIIFAVTGGIDNTDFCVHDNVKSWIALTWLQMSPIITAIGIVYKFCNCIKTNTSGSMKLKDEKDSVIKEFDL
eukprot:35076_1